MILAVILLISYGCLEVNFGLKQKAYFSLLVRIPEFLLGVGLAVFESGGEQGKLPELSSRSANWIGALGGLLLFGSFWLISEDSAFPGGWVLLPCLGAVAVIGARGSVITWGISHPTLVWIGGVSYSLYLWHWPILAFFRYIAETYQLSITMLVAFLVLLMISAYVSWRWIEIPYRRRFEKMSSLVWRVAILVIGVAIPLSLASRVNAAIENPLPVAYTRYANGDEICHGKVVKDCIRGAQGSATEPLLVLGDSHAAQLNIFFDTIGRNNSQQFQVITASSCVTIPGFDVDRIPEYARADCKASIEFAKRYIAESKIIVIAGMWQYHVSSADFVKAFRTFLAEAKEKGKSVIVLAQIPMLSSNVLRLRRFEKLGIGHQVLLHPEWFNANSVMRGIASEFRTARFVDYSDDELFSNVPFFKGRLIYQDSHHLNEIGADEYAKIAAQFFAIRHD